MIDEPSSYLDVRQRLKAAEVIRAGCDGIAVVSAIVSAPNPREAAAKLKAIIRAAKEQS